MIAEWFMDLMAGLQDWFLGLFGDTQAPDWLVGVGGAIVDVIGNAAGLGGWFPFPLMGMLIASLLGLWLLLWSIKGARWVWGLTPFSGGS